MYCYICIYIAVYYLSRLPYIYRDIYKSICIESYCDIAIYVYVLLDMYIYSSILSLTITVYLQIYTEILHRFVLRYGYTCVYIARYVYI